MLRMSTFAEGVASRMRRVATAPFMLGSAKSMTMTSGRSLNAASTASWPSLASPRTRISGSSSSMRRNPRRTSAWSSTRRIVSSARGMRLLADDRRRYADQRASFASRQEFDFAAQHLRAFPHRDQPHAAPVLRAEADAMIFHFEGDAIRFEREAHGHALRARMPGDVRKRFLCDAIKMDADVAVQLAARAGFFVANGDSVLAFERGQVDVERAFETCFIEHHRMQRMRERAHFLQCGLHDFAHLL